MRLGKHRLFSLLALIFLPLSLAAQIRNTMGVDNNIFQRYASGRLQPYAESNIGLADSIFRTGLARNSIQLQALGLSLEMGARFAQGEQQRIDAIARQIHDLCDGQKEMRDFYYTSTTDYCQYLIRGHRISDALIWAREMGRDAAKEGSALGQMYSWRLTGQIHSLRSNPSLAVHDLEKALGIAERAKLFNEFPELYISLARGYLRLNDFEKVDYYRDLADNYSELFPSVAVKVDAVNAAEMYLTGDYEGYKELYPKLIKYPLYHYQIDPDAQITMELCYLICMERFSEALALADRMPVSSDLFLNKHHLYAKMGRDRKAYESLLALTEMRDSLHMKVQNEDMAVLDAEMDNATLRAEAAELRYHNRWIVMLGLVIAMLVASVAILASQWRMHYNLEDQRRRDMEVRLHREEYQRSMEVKEMEIAMKVKILQNRKINNSQKI